MTKRLSVFFGLLLFLLLLSIIGQWSEYKTRALLRQSQPITFRIEPGSSVRSILKNLSLDQRIKPFSPFWFEVFIRLQGASTHIKAGEYILSPQMTGLDLVKKTIAGDVTQYALTIIPGWTVAQAFKHIQSHPAIKKQAASIESLQEALQVSHASLEGLLFPETYYFTYGTSDVQMVQRAYKLMQAKLPQACSAPGELLKDTYQALILASVIEKESNHLEELTLISQVFHNRLKQNMPLQADPTVIYGIEDFDGNITRAHLTGPSPYNTYKIKGLPPTPIAIPSFASIKAACAPSEGDYLYFVAKNDGSHHFSKTHEEHKEKVKQYLLGTS